MVLSQANNAASFLQNKLIFKSGIYFRTCLSLSHEFQASPPTSSTKLFNTKKYGGNIEIKFSAKFFGILIEKFLAEKSFSKRKMSIFSLFCENKNLNIFFSSKKMAKKNR